ncbi:MAG TPA: undecaprenyldiphospho-muramoylpentapeptide beta-N-acetylglucosaminyltransferase [Candidatus Methylacidiphilales bacterium]|nr:undecaprenyldiphospho-muramoylpentapeptide beta-N-acetylglucosaminyltransferase [Candidatus Methylacidiphilales bacterium]
MKIAIACGGTGGHLFPGLAVAEELRERGHDTLLLISPKQIDAMALKGAKNQKARALPGMGWPGFLSPRVFAFGLNLWKSWRECGEAYRDFQPTAVVGMGGFTSAIPLLLGRHLRLPTLIHESNAIPGRVTKLIAPWVNKTLLGFESCAYYLHRAHCVVTGTPVRRGLARMDRAVAAEKFGLNPALPVVLIMGGSQGAHGINELVLKSLPLWHGWRDEVQFIHLTGQADANIAEINYRRQRLIAVVQAFSTEMEHFYSLADVVISRSGAASLTELSHYGLPAILIPYPAATDDHQLLNARIFEEAGAARILIESKTTAETLRQTVEDLLTQPELRRTMAGAASRLAGTDAAQRVAEEIEASCNRN